MDVNLSPALSVSVNDEGHIILQRGQFRIDPVVPISFVLINLWVYIDVALQCKAI